MQDQTRNAAPGHGYDNALPIPCHFRYFDRVPSLVEEQKLYRFRCVIEKEVDQAADYADPDGLK